MAIDDKDTTLGLLSDLVVEKRGRIKFNKNEPDTFQQFQMNEQLNLDLKDRDHAAYIIFNPDSMKSITEDYPKTHYGYCSTISSELSY